MATQSVGIVLVDRVQNNVDWAVIGKCERRQRAVLSCIVATKSGGSPYFLLCLRFKAVGTTSLHRDKAFECVGGQRAAELRLEDVRMRCRHGEWPKSPQVQGGAKSRIPVRRFPKPSCGLKPCVDALQIRGCVLPESLMPRGGRVWHAKECEWRAKHLLIPFERNDK